MFLHLFYLPDICITFNATNYILFLPAAIANNVQIIDYLNKREPLNHLHYFEGGN